MFQSRGRKREAFSRPDAVLLIAMSAVVLGVLACWLVIVRSNHGSRGGDGSRTVNASNLRQLGTAVHMAFDTNKGIPPYFGPYGGKGKGTFHYHLLPYLENESLWKAANTVIPPFLAGNDPTQRNGGAGAANFVVNLRLFYTNGGLGELATGADLIYLKMSKITDGTSNTLLFATKYHVCGANGGSLWLDPGNNAPNSPTAATFGAGQGVFQAAPTKENCDPNAGTAVSFNPQSMQVALCDASVRNIAVSMSPATWKAALTPAGNEPMGVDWPE